MVYFKKNGDLLEYLNCNKGVIRFGRCEIKINMESINSQKELLERAGVGELAIEVQLISAIYSSLMEQIFGEAYYNRQHTDGQRTFVTSSIYEKLESIHLTTKDKLETIDKLFTL